MNARVERVNRELRTLEAAYQGGRMQRAEFRSRRRAVLSALRAQDEITARNVLVPGRTSDPGRGDAYERAAQADASSLLFASRWAMLRRPLVVGVACVATLLVLALVWLSGGDAHA